MGQLSIILIVGFLCLFTYEPPEDIGEINTTQTVFWNLIFTIGPILLAYFVTSVIPRILQSNKTFTESIFSHIRHFRFIFEVLCLGTYLCALYQLDLPVYIHYWLSFFPFVELRQSLGILPLIVSLIGVRLVFHNSNRSSEVRYSELLSFQLKFLLLPLVPLLIYLTTLDIIVRLPEEIQLFLVKHPYLIIGLLLPVLAGAYIFAPLLMRFMWKTVPLSNDILKEKLEKLTIKSKMKYRGISVWKTGSLLIANAAVAGTLKWNRRIFLTDTLLNYFTDDQIETIVAHELGHIRYKHIPTYILFSCLYLLSYPIFIILVENPILQLLPLNILEKYPFLSTIGSLLFFVLYFIFGFRYVSRRFEHQADLYAVSLTNKPDAFIAALERLALFNSIPISVRRIFELFNTHPSIYRRVEFIYRYLKGDTKTNRYQNYLIETKLLVILLPIFCAAALILLFVF